MFNRYPASLFSSIGDNEFCADRSDLEKEDGHNWHDTPRLLEIADDLTGGHRLFILDHTDEFCGDPVNWVYVSTEYHTQVRVIND